MQILGHRLPSSMDRNSEEEKLRLKQLKQNNRLRNGQAEQNVQAGQRQQRIGPNPRTLRNRRIRNKHKFMFIHITHRSKFQI